MKKLKKYVLMIPLLAVMLLNCVCYGQLIASASNTFDYTFNEAYRDRMHHYDELNVNFDFSDADLMIENYIASSGVGVKDYYIYFLYAYTNNYHNFSSFDIYLNFYFVRDGLDSIVYNQNVIYFSSYDYTCTFNYNRSTSVLTNLDFSNSSFTNASDRVTSYCPSTGFHYNVHSGLFGDNNKYNAFTKDYCYLYQGSNIPDFPLPYEQVDNSLLNVNVTFSPELTGAFNRTVTDRGQKVTLDEFSFTVENNSKFDVQYLMAIHKIDDSFYPFPDPINAGYMSVNGKTYTGSPVYVYVKDEWLFLPHGVQGIITAYAPSSWHKVLAGSVDSVTVNFNQLKLNSVDVYDVEVYAVRNDFNYVSPFTNHNTFNYPASADCSIVQEDVQLVYSSRFNIANPAEFDPNNNENSYAYDEDDRFLFNRANGYIDENGETVIDRVDTNQFVNAGNDPDDPWRGWDDSNDAWEYYYKNQNTVSSDIDQLSNNFSSFFKFVNKVFSYFPKNYQNIIMLGLTSIVVLAVIKVVF